jgi:hypothetical protein
VKSLKNKIKYNKPIYTLSTSIKQWTCDAKYTNNLSINQCNDIAYVGIYMYMQVMSLNQTSHITSKKYY